MSYVKRILILSGINDKKQSGYLTLNKSDNVLNCNLKTAMLKQNTDYLLAMSINNEALSNIYINSTEISNYNFTLNQNLNILEKINILIAEKQSAEPILYGSTTGDRVEGLTELKNKIIASTSQTSKPYSSHLFDVNENEVETLINEDFSNTVETPFFAQIKEQVEEMFNTYPKFPDLETVMPDSKWIKVDYEQNGQYYALGLIFENEEIKYICYAIPSNTPFSPPQHIAQYCQWLEISPDTNAGFYIMYQDAQSGTSIKM